MTVQEAAQTAIEAQDAVNLSGVLASFHHVVIDALWPEARKLGKGTEWVNQHPICMLFFDKLTDFNRRGDFGSAYTEVKRLANAEVPA